MRWTPLIARCLAAVAAIATAAPVLAGDAFPSKPIKIIVCTAPGGATDVTARLVGQKMSEKLGVQVIVENKPGGDTLLGILHTKEQPADGYTLLAQSLGFSTLPYIKKEPGYVTSDFIGLGNMATIPFIMIVGANGPDKTLADYVARAKKEKLSYGHGGIASAPQITGERFLKAYGLSEISIPYKGNGAVMPDVMAGRVSMFFDAQVSSGEFIRSGKMRALAVAGPTRLPQLPDVPTFKELGVDLQANVWLGLLLRRETPPDVVNKLSEALHFAVKELEPRFKAEGSDPTFYTPQQWTAYITKEAEDMGKLAADLKWEKQ